MSAYTKGMSESQMQEKDKKLGGFLRLLRRHHGISQKTMAKVLHVSFQQVQKYENGVNRISASKIEAAANYMNIPVSVFFSWDDMMDDDLSRYIEHYRQENQLLGLFHEMGDGEKSKLVQIAKIITEKESHGVGATL